MRARGVPIALKLREIAQHRMRYGDAKFVVKHFADDQAVVKKLACLFKIAELDQYGCQTTARNGDLRSVVHLTASLEALFVGFLRCFVIALKPRRQAKPVQQFEAYG